MNELIYTPLLIKASAGTGKTTDLSNRYIALLADNESPEHILATTFTKKAAGEIRDRILQRLASAALDKTAAEKLSSAIERKIDCNTAQDILQLLINNQHKLNISTLDSFFNQIISSFALELGLSPNWQVEDPSDLNDFYLDVLDRICEKNSKDMLEILRLISKKKNSAKVVSNFGSDIVKFHQIFRNSSADSWKWVEYDKTQLLSDAEVKKITQRLENLDFSSFKKSINDGVTGVIELLHSRKWMELATSTIIKNIQNATHKYCNTKIPEEVENLLLPLSAHAIQETIKLLKIKNESTYQLLQIFHNEYEAARNESATLSFEDITTKLKEAKLTTDLDLLYYRLDSKIRHLLLDEFQDTSITQWQIIEPIADEIMASAGVERSFFCVGDIKQAIYGWRGGESAIFDSLENRWLNLAVKTKEKTYRCSTPILDTVNQVFSSLTENTAFKDYYAVATKWQSNFNNHSSAIDNNDGYVTFTEYEKNDEEEEVDILQLVAKQAVEILERHPDFTIGILTRKKNYISQIKNAFNNLPNPPEVSVEGSSPLTDSIAVNACLALLHIIDHPTDEVAHFILKNTPLGAVINFPNGAITEFAKRERQTISKIGYGEYFNRISKLLQDSCSMHDRQRLEQLAELGFSRSNWSSARVEEFSDFVQATRVETPSSAQIRIMTIHKSKGLEFDAVILPDLNRMAYKDDNILRDRPNLLNPPEKVSHALIKGVREFYPKLQDMADAERAIKIEESLCLLYVAMTRARTELHMHVKASSKGLTFKSILKNALAPDSNFYSNGEPSTSKLKKQSIEVSDSAVPVINKTPIKRYTVKRPSDLKNGNDVKYVLDIKGKSVNLGTILHNILQQIVWVDEDLPDKETLFSNIKISATNDELEKGYKLFQAALAFPEFNSALSKARYKAKEVEVLREQRFSVFYKDQLISGAFDRLVLSYDSKHQITSAEVIDFKSDFFPNPDDENFLQDKITFYTPQLEAYREAASVFLKISQDSVRASLLFARIGKLVEI